MRKTMVWAVLFFVATAVTAQEADIVYIDGIVDVKLADGERMEAFIGDYLAVGDTIITSEDSLAELETESGSAIKIAEDTIFTFQELEQDGEKRSVLSTTLGSVAFRFNKFTGREPLIATPGTIAGIRGTEFLVFAGADGATLVVVESGKVEVEAQGSKVELLPDEGVEVLAGGAPGEKFKVLRGQLDFSAWNSTRLDAMLDDPAGTIKGVEKGMEAFRRQITELLPVYEENVATLREERENLKKLEEEKGKEARKQRYENVVFPLEVETSYMRLNLRYHALSALSFRRHVLGSMYAQVKTAYLNRLDTDGYRAFERTYRRILADYQRDIGPLLVDADI
jgi:hypothetical protein